MNWDRMLLKITFFVTIVGLCHCQGDTDREPNRRRVCERGWTDFDNSCYVYIRMPESWWSAKKFCKTYGADLVSITSGDENRFVADLAEGVEAWIGLSDAWPPAGMAALGAPLAPLKLDPKWNWSDGTPFPGPNRYQNWGPLQPSGFQDCVQINYGGKGLWDDNDFWAKQHFVCERPMRQRRENQFRRRGNEA